MNLLFVGDVMLGRLVNRALTTLPASYPWGDTLSLFESAAVRICNLECVIADGGSPWIQTPKVFHFRSDAKNVEVLKAAHIDVVALANNHVLDYGYEALLEMLDTLKHEGIHHAGAGSDLRTAYRPAFFTRGNWLIGCIAFTDNEPCWEAERTVPGVCYVPINVRSKRAQALFQLVEQAKARVDWLIVCAHWGGNWGYHVPREHVRFAHALIEHGADIIFGHSCHVFRGIELYHARPILYSCGDFIDDYHVDEVERNDESFVYVVEIADSGIHELRLYPTCIRDFQAQRTWGWYAKSIAAKMQDLCIKLKTRALWDGAEGCLRITA
jgi:poly-gamma-glutamate synthesis protein (capsule biosynthesis protein)